MGAVTKLADRLFTPVGETAGIEESFDVVVPAHPCMPAEPKPHGRGPRDG